MPNVIEATILVGKFKGEVALETVVRNQNRHAAAVRRQGLRVVEHNLGALGQDSSLMNLKRTPCQRVRVGDDKAVRQRDVIPARARPAERVDHVVGRVLLRPERRTRADLDVRGGRQSPFGEAERTAFDPRTARVGVRLVEPEDARALLRKNPNSTDAIAALFMATE